MEKHTPGPWKRDIYERGLVTAQFPDGRLKEVVANVGSEEDARLIAAAPMMFDALNRALENALDTIEQVDAHVKIEAEAAWLQEVRDNAVRTRDDARAAIRRATEGA